MSAQFPTKSSTLEEGRDPETGLQLNRNRFLYFASGPVDKTAIRLGYDGGTWNLYEYVNGMPLGGTDSWGTAYRHCVSTGPSAAWESAIPGTPFC